MGPSGSGKSTLLHILGALDTPSTGTVTLDGDNPFELDEKQLAPFRNEKIGFVFQDHCLLPQCSVLENVLTPTLVARSTNDSASERAALLDQVGLTERLDHRPAELSGGEKQRVALARALINEPHFAVCATSRRAISTPVGRRRSLAASRAARAAENHSGCRDSQCGSRREISRSLRNGRAEYQASVMRLSTLLSRNLIYFWRSNLAVVLGVATAVAVLAGALLVGDSVRGSLRDLFLQRSARPMI